MNTGETATVELKKIFRKGVAFDVSFSMIDQAILSLLNFAIGLYFIYFSTKIEYAIYTQVMAVVFLSTAFQSAMINSPFMTILPRKNNDEKYLFIKMASLIQNIFLGVAVFLTGMVIYVLGSSIFGNFDKESKDIILPVIVTMFVSWKRDFIRNALFSDCKVKKVLIIDTVYVALVLMLLMFLHIRNRQNSFEILMALGCAGWISLFIYQSSSQNKKIKFTELRNTLKEFWPLAKWALPAGIVSWVFSNGYTLIASQVLSTTSIAEIAASKLFLGPLGVFFLAWANIFRPTVTRLAYVRNYAKIKYLINISFVLVFLFVVVYTGFVYLFSINYSIGHNANSFDLRWMIIWWGCFFCISGFISVTTGVLLAFGLFKKIFIGSVVGAAMSTPLLFVLGEKHGIFGIMAALILGELVTLGIGIYMMGENFKKVISS